MIDTIDLPISLDRYFCQGQIYTVTKCQGHAWQVCDREKGMKEGVGKTDGRCEERQTDVEN